PRSGIRAAVFVDRHVAAAGKGRRIVHTVYRDVEGLRGRRVVAAVRGAAVVLEIDGDDGGAVRVRGRRVGQRAVRGDRRLRAEERVVVVRGNERERLWAGVFENGGGRADLERRRIVDRIDGDRRGGAVGSAVAIVGAEDERVGAVVVQRRRVVDGRRRRVDEDDRTERAVRRTGD